jgi:hypothetical protein
MALKLVFAVALATLKSAAPCDFNPSSRAPATPLLDVPLDTSTLVFAARCGAYAAADGASARGAKKQKKRPRTWVGVGFFFFFGI